MPEDNDVIEGTELENQPDSDEGTGDGSDNEGTPGQPNGEGGDTATLEQVQAELDEMRKQNIALNRALVEARRQANSSKNSYKPGQANDQGNGQSSDFNTAMRLAEGDVRAELDGILELYPELPANMVKLIRSNPWAYSSRESFMSLNVANALLDIEQYVADYVAGIAPATPAPQPKPAVPASKVKPNAPAIDEGDDEDIVPGSPEDTNPWTMPIDKLERRVARKFSKK